MTIDLPLKGIKVVDFGQQIAAPAVAMILADLGATVIHIDPPSGPLWDSPANATLNRNKLNIKLDLTQPKQRQQAHLLIAQADIVIENFRPTKLKQLGINFDELRQNRPELITLSMPGFASNDQLRKDWKATEAIVAATSGAYTDMGFNRILMGLNPSFSPLPLGSAYATTLASTAIMLALYSRQKSGRGDHIEVPIVAALMEGLSYNSINIENMPERYLTMREQEIATRRQQQRPMDVSYQELQEYLDPFYRTYQCADGRYFYVVCPSHRNHSKRCLKITGLYDELIAQGLPEVEDLFQPISQWQGETSIGVYPLPKKWADIISAKMKQVFLTKTSTEWGVIFGENGIPGAPHRSTQEWLNSQHCIDAGLTVTVNDPQYGPMKQPGPIAWLEDSAQAMLTPNPRQYGDVSDALTRLAIAQQYAHKLPTVTQTPPKGWLEGIKILDLTNVIAGPHSTSFLSRFGADVIKLDPVKPLYDPLIGVFFSFLANIGKQSALIDIMSSNGREIFNKLVQEVDIVVINAPERQLRPLGLDQMSLSAVNPEVIFCRLDCFGGPTHAQKTNYIGYDDIIQANSGIMSRFGGAQTPEEHAHLGTLDVNCGFAAGLSMVIALYQKQVSGKISRCRTSLSAVTNLAQINFAYDYLNRAPFNEASGRKALGNHPLSHFYQTQDKWVFLDTNRSELEKLSNIELLQDITSVDNVAQYLQQQFQLAPVSYWLAQFQQYDIAAAEPLSIEYLRKQYTRPADGRVGTNLGSYAFSKYAEHPSGLTTTVIDHYSIRPTDALIFASNPTQKFGYSTRRILTKMGLNKSQINQLIANNIASESWSDEFLPS